MIEAKKRILGIDLGTSSVKLLKWDPDGTVKNAHRKEDLISIRRITRICLSLIHI